MDNKTLTEILAIRLGKDKGQISKLIADMTECMGHLAREMDVVSVPGFGSFEPRKRLERISFQPSTGKRLLIPPKIVLGFRPSAVLKQKVKEGSASTSKGIEE